MHVFLQHTLSSIPDGDREKVVERMSTATNAYRPNVGDYRPFTGTDPYTKLYATTFTQSDGHGKFNNYRSTVADTFKPQPLYGKLLAVAKSMISTAKLLCTLTSLMIQLISTIIFAYIIKGNYFCLCVFNSSATIEHTYIKLCTIDHSPE